MVGQRDAVRERGAVLCRAPLRGKAKTSKAEEGQESPDDYHPVDFDRLGEEDQKGPISDTRRSGGGILLAIGVGTILWTIVASYMIDDSDLIPLDLVMIGLGVMFAILGAAVLFGARKRREPDTIYSKGFTTSDGLGGRLFVPWEAVWSFKEYEVEGGDEVQGLDSGATDHHRSVGEVLELHGRGSTSFDVASDFDNYSQIRSLVLGHAGQGWSDSREFNGALRRGFVKTAVLMLVLALFAGFLFAALFTVMMPTVLGVGLNGAAIFGPIIAMVLFPMFLALGTKGLWGIPTGALPHGAALACMAALLLLLVGVSDAVDLSESAPVTDVYTSDYDMKSALKPGEYTDLRTTIDSPIVVRGGERLVLRDCALAFDLDYYETGIDVAEGGALVMEGTWLRNIGSESSYSIEVRGSLSMTGCILESMYYHESYISGLRLSGGLELRTDDATVRDTTFRASQGCSILVIDCSPAISGCTFNGSGKSGIRIVRGSPTVTGCEFHGAHEGIYMERSSPTITGCTFQGCECAISVLLSSPTIRGCTFMPDVSLAVGTDLYSDADEAGSAMTAPAPVVSVRDHWPLKEQPWIMQRRDSWPWLGAVITAFATVLILTSISRLQNRRIPPWKRRKGRTE